MIKLSEDTLARYNEQDARLKWQIEKLFDKPTTILLKFKNGEVKKVRVVDTSHSYATNYICDYFYLWTIKYMENSVQKSATFLDSCTTDYLKENMIRLEEDNE